MNRLDFNCSNLLSGALPMLMDNVDNVNFAFGAMEVALFNKVTSIMSPWIAALIISICLKRPKAL